jgi:serine/threonine-protein kinase
MPFVEGESLRGRLARDEPVTQADAVRMLREVASALAFAHAHDVVHRDIKPDNVLLSRGAAMVTDFGVAKAVSASSTTATDTVTSIGMVVGTPAYMSPEQASGDPHVDHRADIYAWGVLAYEVLTGQPPFAGRPVAAILAAHVTEAPANLTLARPAISPALAALVMQCLEKSPSARPPSADDIVRALDTITSTGGGSVAAAPAPRSRTLPIAVAALVIVALGGGAWWMSRGSSAPAANVTRSIAVLPFENVRGDSTEEYFAMGMTDDIASALTSDGLRVAPRASSMTFEGKHATAQDVGSTLSVDAVLTGSVSRLGEKLHVTVELADAKTGAALIAFPLDRETKDLFAVQKVITDTIVRVLRGKLTASAAPKHQDDPIAHDLIQRGRFLSDLGTRDGLNRAIASFDAAIERDPLAVGAYVGLAYAYNYICDGFEPPINAYPKAQVALARAMQVDSLNDEVWAMRASMSAYEWNWPRMRQEFERASALNPNQPLNVFAGAIYWQVQGERAKAVQLANEFARRDPLNAAGLLMREWSYFFNKQYDSTVTVGQQLQQLAPGFVYLDGFAGFAFGQQKRYAQAESAFKAAEPALGHRSPGLAWVYALQGKKAEARAILAEIERDQQTKYVVPEMVAWAYDALADTEQTYAWLERGLVAHSWWAAMSTMWPGFEKWKNEPRYVAMRKRMNLE